MKKIIVLFMLVSAIVSAESEMYKKVPFLDGEIYFPKTTAEYIDGLLEDKSIESYAKLAEVYYKLGNEDIVKKYFNIYMSSSAGYLEKSRLCHNVGEYGQEVNMILKYIEDKPIAEKVYYRNYISKLMNTKGIDIYVKGGTLNKVDVLMTYLDSEDEFTTYYNSNNWSESENKKIIEILKKKELSSKNEIFDLFRKLANGYDVADYFYYKIENNYDKDGYAKYYGELEKDGIEPIIRNEFEKLHYFLYKNNTVEYKKLVNELEIRFNKTKEYKKLYTLYKISGDMAIMQNLAMISEDFNYRYLNEMYQNDLESQSKRGIKSDISIIYGENRDAVLRGIDTFGQVYPNSGYIEELTKIKLAYFGEGEEALRVADAYLKKKSDRYVILRKADILNKSGRRAEAEQLLYNAIQNGIADDSMISYYIDMINFGKSGNEMFKILSSIDDKHYLFEFCRKNGIKIPSEYENEAIDYFFNLGDYMYLYQYKDKLTYDQYKRIIDNNMLVFIESANKKYPYEKSWMDLSKQEYFYFNEDYKDFSALTARMILEKRIRTDAENYYIARYLYYAGEYGKAKEYIKGIASRYTLSTEIKDFYKKIEYGEGTNE